MSFAARSYNNKPINKLLYPLLSIEQYTKKTYQEQPPTHAISTSKNQVDIDEKITKKNKRKNKTNIIHFLNKTKQNLQKKNEIEK